MNATQKLHALVIGATGATGKCLVEELLGDDAFRGAALFVRRSTGLAHPKLIEHVIDFSRLELCAEKIVGDVLFCSLGTTRKIAGSVEAQRQVDLELQSQFATLARRNGVKTCILVSSSGASASSAFAYPKMKGELEERIASLGFDRFVIFQPGPLERPGSDRSAERVAVAALHGLNRLGLAKRLRPMPVRLLAQKLVKAAKRSEPGQSLIRLDRIFTY